MTMTPAIMVDMLTEKLENILGYYERSPSSRNAVARCMRASFNSATGFYWIQAAYMGSQEKRPKRWRNQKSFRKELQKYIKDNYLKTTEPTDCKFKKVQELTLARSIPAPVVAVTPTVSTLQSVEGKTVVIRHRVLNIREGKFDYVPAIDKDYYFTELTEDVIDDLQENKRILLSGHTGCGKTSLYEQIAARINQSFLRVNMNGQTTIGDLVGMWTARASDKGSETVWVDGVLPYAMKNGHWLVIDEIDCADPSILAVLNSVLEKNGTLTLKEKGHEIVEAHKDFRILSTANSVGCMAQRRSLYPGANIMNEAFLDRFRVYHMDYLPENEEISLLMKKVKGLNQKQAKLMVQVANGVRESFNKEDLSCTFSFRRLMDWAEMTIRHNDIQKAARLVIYSKTSDVDRATIDGIVKRFG